MKMKKIVSAAAALAIAATAFAAVTITASAADPAGVKVAGADFSEAFTTYSNGNNKQSGDFILNESQWTVKPYIDNEGWLKMGNSTGTITIPDSYLKTDSDDVITIKFKIAYGSLNGKTFGYTIKDSKETAVVSWDVDRYKEKINTNILGTSEQLPTLGDTYSTGNIIKDRAAEYTFTFDFGAGTVTQYSKCYISGTSRTATEKTYTNKMQEGVNDIKTLSFTSNYNNKERVCAVDDIEIWTTAEKASTYPVANSVIITGADTVFNGTSADYKAVVKDQFGNDFNETVTLSLISAPQGVTFESNKLTVAADAAKGTAVIGASSASGITAQKSVTIRPANHYTMTYKSSLDGAIIAQLTDVEENTKLTFNYPRYIVKDGVAYSASRSNGNSSPYGREFAAVTSDFEETITYTQEKTNVVYYSEAEDIEGFIAGNDEARLSSGQGGYVTEATTITTLPAGKYKVTVAGRQLSTSSDATYTVTVGEQTAVTFTTAGSWASAVGDEITVTEDSEVVVSAVGAGGKYLLDYVLIEKTGEYEPPIATTEKGYAFNETTTVAELKTKTLTIKATNGEGKTAEDSKSLSALGINTTGISDTSNVKFGLIITEIPEDVTITSIVIE